MSVTSGEKQEGCVPWLQGSTLALSQPGSLPGFYFWCLVFSFFLYLIAIFLKKHITLYQYIIYNVHIVILYIYNTHILMSRSKCSEDVEGWNIKLGYDQYNQSQERTQREKRRVKPYKTWSKSKVPSYLCLRTVLGFHIHLWKNILSKPKGMSLTW